MAQAVDSFDEFEDDGDEPMDNKSKIKNSDGINEKQNETNDVDFEDDNEWGDDDDNDDDGDWGDLKTQDALMLPVRPLSVSEKMNKHNNNDEFWQCGNCDFKNNVWRSVCMACHIPKTEIIASLLNQNESNKSSKEKNKSSLIGSLFHSSNNNNNNNSDKNSDNSKDNNVVKLDGKLGTIDSIKVCEDLPKCKRCKSYIIEDLRDWHNELCAPIATEIAWNDQWYVPLSKLQKEAINNILQKSMKESNECLEELKSRVETLGFSQEALNKTLHFMEWKVPITIRISKDIISKYLIKDPYLRNLFETNTSKGSTDKKQRQGWETRMFGETYDKGSAFERPKYGCLNVSLKSEGEVGAAVYGECYFVLKDMTCRWRTTLTNTDSCQADSVIGILSHCCHVLNKFAPNDLSDLINVACQCDEMEKKEKEKEKEKEKDKETEKGKENNKDDKDTTSTSTAATTTYYDNVRPYYYREIQIHGLVRTNVDISQLWIPLKYIDDQDIRKFVKLNNIELKLIGT